MNEPSAKSGRTLLLLWAVAATFVAVVSTSLSLFLFLRTEEPRSPRSAADASRLPTISEETVAGRYKWIAEGEEEGVITFLPDRTFIPSNARKTQAHRWEMGRNTLLVIFAARIHRFTNTEPGVYISTASDGRTARMEKEK